MKFSYLTTTELAERIHYDAWTIRNKLVDVFFFEGRHYIRPFGGKKFLFLWENIEEDMLNSAQESDRLSMPMAVGE